MVKISRVGIFWLAYLFFMIGLVIFIADALCFTVTLAWDMNQEPDLAKYTLYYRGTKLADIVKDPTTGIIPTSYTHGNVPSGVHTYWLTASDETGNESGRSNAVVQPLANWTVTIVP